MSYLLNIIKLFGIWIETFNFFNLKIAIFHQNNKNENDNQYSKEKISSWKHCFTKLIFKKFPSNCDAQLQSKYSDKFCGNLCKGVSLRHSELFRWTIFTPWKRLLSIFSSRSPSLGDENSFLDHSRWGGCSFFEWRHLVKVVSGERSCSLGEVMIS